MKYYATRNGGEPLNLKEIECDELITFTSEFGSASMKIFKNHEIIETVNVIKSISFDGLRIYRFKERSGVEFNFIPDTDEELEQLGFRVKYMCTEYRIEREGF